MFRKSLRENIIYRKTFQDEMMRSFAVQTEDGTSMPRSESASREEVRLWTITPDGRVVFRCEAAPPKTSSQLDIPASPTNSEKSQFLALRTDLPSGYKALGRTADLLKYLIDLQARPALPCLRLNVFYCHVLGRRSFTRFCKMNLHKI